MVNQVEDEFGFTQEITQCICSIILSIAICELVLDNVLLELLEMILHLKRCIH